MDNKVKAAIILGIALIITALIVAITHRYTPVLGTANVTFDRWTGKTFYSR